MQGRPSVIILVSVDQPGNEHRMEKAGVAEVVLLPELTAETLHAAAEKVMAHFSYTERAKLLGKTIEASQGMQRPVQLVEQELSN